MKPVRPTLAAPASRNAPPPPPAVPVVGSDALLGAVGQLRIRHAGREYRLRITSNGKLILTA